jgi:CBS domain-containing protein
MRVNEIMTSDPVVCTFACTTNVVAGVMRELDVGIVPVVENLTSRKLIGVVTDRDLAVRVLAEGRNPSYMTMQECMTKDPVFCHPEDDVPKVLALMAEHQVRRIPVVDKQQKIVGIVSMSDLIRHVAVNARDLYVVISRISETRAEAIARAA